MGLPAEHAARTCLLAVRLAQELGVGGQQLADVFYVDLRRYVGCTADAHEVAGSVGDEIRLAAGVRPWVMGGIAERSGAAMEAGVPGGRVGAELGMARALAVHSRRRRSWPIAWVWARMCRWPCSTGLSNGMEAAIRTAWPARRSRCPPASRWWRVMSSSGAVADRRSVAADVVRRRRGRAYDPAVADAFLSAGARLMVDPDDAHPAALFAENRIR